MSASAGNATVSAQGLLTGLPVLGPILSVVLGTVKALLPLNAVPVLGPALTGIIDALSVNSTDAQSHAQEEQQKAQLAAAENVLSAAAAQLSSAMASVSAAAASTSAASAPTTTVAAADAPPTSVAAANAPISTGADDLEDVESAPESTTTARSSISAEAAPTGVDFSFSGHIGEPAQSSAYGM